MTRRELTYRQMPVPADLTLRSVTDACEIYKHAVGKLATHIYLGLGASEDWVRVVGRPGLTETYVPEFMSREWAVGDNDGPVYGSRGVK